MMKILKSLFLIVLLLSSQAYAAGGQQDITTQTLEKSANDTSHEKVSDSAIAMAIAMFGDVVMNPMSAIGSNASGDSMILAKVFGVINGSLLALGTIWVSYSVVTGTLLTAHEGEFMGKKMSSIWVPVRLVVGVGSLVPVFGGYALAQIVMLWGIQMGIGIGNLGWNVAVGHFTKDGQSLISVKAPPSNNLAMEVFRSQVCVDSLNLGEATSMSSAADSASASTTPISGAYAAWGNGSVISYGKKDINASCGSFKLPTVTASSAGVMGSGNNAKAGYNQVDEFGASSITTNQTSLSESSIHASELMKNAFNDMRRDIASLSLQYHTEVGKWYGKKDQTTSPKFNKIFVSKLDAIAANYDKKIKDGIRSIQANLNNSTANNSGLFLQAIQKDAKDHGFINAGAWYMTIGTANSLAQDAISKKVSVVTSAREPTPVPSDDVYRYTNGFISSGISQSGNKAINAASSDGKEGADDLFFSVIEEKVCEFGGTGNLIEGRTFGQCAANLFISDSTNQPAIVRIANTGNNITAFGAIVITGIGAANGLNDSVLSKAADLIPWKAAASGSLRIWLDVMKVIAEMLFFWGIIASVWIPMIPTVIWIGAVASLLAVWAEAVVAAPLWAFAHLDTEGEGMGQRTQTGYLFILNVLLRPILMVVGFLLGSIMVGIMMEYVTNLMPTIIANASADSWTGIIKIMGFIAAFVIILQTVVSLSFGMIRFVPDQVLGWLGGNMVNQIGAQAEDSVGGAAKNAMAARGSVSGAASQASQAKKQRQGEKQANEWKNNPENPANRQAEAMESMAKHLGAGGQATVKGPGAAVPE